RVIRQLKEVPPQAGHDIHLTIDLQLQAYIETLLQGSRAAVVVTDPRT
ncbi:MAG TPA: penicillin-binding protein 2, partial [Enterobacteriaceae bacterium]|nr:penicillin-binding protein 2 [Enterobacteriaceae bacterium]